MLLALSKSGIWFAVNSTAALSSTRHIELQPYLIVNNRLLRGISHVSTALHQSETSVSSTKWKCSVYCIISHVTITCLWSYNASICTSKTIENILSESVNSREVNYNLWQNSVGTSLARLLQNHFCTIKY